MFYSCFTESNALSFFFFDKMHTTETHPLINKITRVYFLVGFWHQGDNATGRELTVKFVYSIFLLLFLLSIAMGAIAHENRDKSIYLGEIAILDFVFVSKLFILIWQQKKVEALLNRICVFTVRDNENLAIFNERLSPFIKFGNVLLISTMICVFCDVAVYPFIGREKTLVLEIAFPLNWRDSEISFWIANLFILVGAMLVLAAISFSVIIFYLLLICSSRYELLGSDMRKAGQRITGEILDREKPQIYYRDSIALIKVQLNLQEYVE